MDSQLRWLGEIDIDREEELLRLFAVPEKSSRDAEVKKNVMQW